MTPEAWTAIGGVLVAVVGSGFTYLGVRTSGRSPGTEQATAASGPIVSLPAGSIDTTAMPSSIVSAISTMAETIAAQQAHIKALQRQVDELDGRDTQREREAAVILEHVAVLHAWIDDGATPPPPPIPHEIRDWIAALFPRHH